MAMQRLCMKAQRNAGFHFASPRSEWLHTPSRLVHLWPFLIAVGERCDSRPLLPSPALPHSPGAAALLGQAENLPFVSAGSFWMPYGRRRCQNITCDSLFLLPSFISQKCWVSAPDISLCPSTFLMFLRVWFVPSSFVSLV